MKRCLLIRIGPVFASGCRLAAALLVVCLGASAQDFQCRVWGTENGLADRTITSVAQTADGYLWVGTPKGLNRFDGSIFTPAGAAGGGALSDSRIVGLLADHQGGLWIASQSGVITEFSHGKFQVRYPVAGDISPGGFAETHPRQAQAWLGLNSVFGLDSTGRVWVATMDGKVVCFANPGAPVEQALTGFPSGEIHGLLNDRSGRVWLLKGTNCCVLDGGQWNFSPPGQVSGSGQLLCPAGNHGFWKTEASETGVFVTRVQFERDDGWQASSLPVPTTPVHPPVLAMLQDSSGRLWVAPQWGGVYWQLRGGDWKRAQVSGPLLKVSALCFFEDRQGGIWVGTEEQGLYQIIDSSVRMILLPPEAADVHASTVCVGKDGGLWMGTDKGLYHHAAADPAVAREVEYFTGKSIYSVLEDSQTNLWVGTEGGLFRQEGAGFKREPVPKKSGILALYEDRAGDLWAGGFDSTLLHLSRGGGWTLIRPKKGMPPMYVNSITEDNRGQIWVASKRGGPGAGVCRVEGQQLVPPPAPLAVIHERTRAVLFDADGALWIGTHSDGLYRWNNGALQHFTSADGLPDDVIYGLAADDGGNLWMTTKIGIIGCSRGQLAQHVRGQSPPLLCVQLGSDQGMANPECVGAGQPAITRGPDGRFWASSMLGSAGFSPETVSRPATVDEVRVDTLTVDGVALNSLPEGYRTSASSRRFEFRYSVPDLTFAKSLRFRYRLVGLDPDWIDAGAARLAAYSQLPPGHYAFRVTVGGVDGLWREARTPVQLTVVPRFWQTFWFHTVALVTLMAALAGGVVWNERRKFRLRTERLEAQQAIERTRHRIAQDLHDDLGSAITEITQLGDLTLRAWPGPEALQSRVKTMTSLARQLGITVDEIVWTMSSRNDTLPNLAGYISNHAEEFFRHSGIQCGLDVMKNLPNVAVNSQTRHNLFLAAKEAMNNVAKHSQATEVILRVHYAPVTLRVSVEDNGRGFDGTVDRQGHGLANMRERLQAVNGRAEFLTRPGGGTKVLFTLDLAPAREADHRGAPNNGRLPPG